MGNLYLYKYNIFKEKIEIENLKKAIAFVDFFDDEDDEFTFEFATKNLTNDIENIIKIKKRIMTLENNIQNQITFYQNELIALSRNEIILDYDRKLKKENLEKKLEQWQLRLAKLIEVNEEKSL